MQVDLPSFPGQTRGEELEEAKRALAEQKSRCDFGLWGGLAGGGVRGGIQHGATDDIGFHAVSDRHYVTDIHATILHLLGFDHEKFTYRYAGRDFRLTDVHGQVMKDVLA